MRLKYPSSESAGLDVGEQGYEWIVNLDFSIFPHVDLYFLLQGEK